ncbi:MAG TPA: hypothetical protein VFN50_08005 [Acidimicrobiales bacterium]|nr:hypothetical protein [Acidimicrobiales bacterium]
MEDPPLRQLIEGSPGGAPEGALAAVVRRHRRRRARAIGAVGSVAVVAAGTALGVGLARTPGAGPGPAALGDAAGGTRHEAAALAPGLRVVRVPKGLSPVPALPGSNDATFASSQICTFLGCGGAELGKLTFVLGRHVEGIGVRAYLVTFARPSQGTRQPLTGGAVSGAVTTTSTGLPLPPDGPLLPMCSRSGELLVRVSVDGAPPATVVAPSSTGVAEPFETLAEAVVGGHHPVLVALAEVGASVGRVEARFGGGSKDAAVPSKGWVVLVGRAASAGQARRDGVSLVALSPAGGLLERASLQAPRDIAVPSSCAAGS